MKFRLNVPNVITILRVALIPVFVIVFRSDIPYKSIISAVLFLAISFSDMLDGHLARRLKQVTEFGKLIDPIADKLLISTVLVILIGKGVDLWMALVIIAREAILTAARLYLLKSHPVIPASFLGKSKTFIQIFAIVFVILGLSFSWYAMLIAVILTLVSGIEYVFQIKKMTGIKVVNIPNLITLSRLLLVIPYLYYLYQGNINTSIMIFAVIAISDKIDGIFARAMNQKTELGGALDSFTDWTLIINSFFMFAIIGYISPLWVFLMIIPGIVSGAMKMIHASKLKKVPVTSMAKLSVGLTYITLIVIMARFGFKLAILEKTMGILMISSLIAVYLSMIIYIYKN